MHKRVGGVILTAAFAALALTGCQAVTPSTFTRARAQADVATWTRDAETALGSQTASIRFDGYETCRTDHSYFATTFEWRTVTSLSVPRERQAAAISTLSAAFVARKWSNISSPGLVTLGGPKGASHTGLIKIERGGTQTLNVSVISPCYS